MRPGGGKAKGSAFERSFCKQLSLWWTSGEDPDVFWRTHSSGGKKGVSEESGDVMAIKASGKKLMDHIHIELKCVSDTDLLLDLIRPNDKKSKIMDWFVKATNEGMAYGKSPLLVVKLSNRTTFCMFEKDSNWVGGDIDNILTYNETFITMEWDRFLKDNCFKEHYR